MDGPSTRRYAMVCVTAWLIIIAAFSSRCSRSISTTSSRTPAAWSAAERAGALDLFAVDMIDPLRGWAAGDIDPRGVGGALFRTTDGGHHWTPIAGQTDVTTSVHFIDRKTGWIAGYAGRIDRTDDGGISWHPQRPERGREVFNSIWAVDERHVWAVGADGLGARSIDGGATWTPMALGPPGDFWSVRFESADRGWAVGDAGAIVATNDGGATWTKAASGVARTLFGVAVAESSVVAVGDGGSVVRSEDGTTWTPVASPTRHALYGVNAHGRTMWAVGAHGATIGSEDAGATWTSIPPVADVKLAAVAVADVRHAAAVGRKGFVQIAQ